jgi:hypothetical protein
MHVIVEITSHDEERPPIGASIRVEARDTTYEDAPAEVVGSAAGEVRETLGELLDTVELSLWRRPDSCVVWVHVDVDGDGRISAGDYITMVAYPIPPAEDAVVPVAVRRV